LHFSHFIVQHNLSIEIINSLQGFPWGKLSRERVTDEGQILLGKASPRRQQAAALRGEAVGAVGRVLAPAVTDEGKAS